MVCIESFIVVVWEENTVQPEPLPATLLFNFVCVCVFFFIYVFCSLLQKHISTWIKKFDLFSALMKH